MGWQYLVPVETAVWLGSCRLIKQRVRGSQQLKRHLKAEYGGIWWPSRLSEPNCWLLWQQTMTRRVHMLWCHCTEINTSSCRRKSLRQSKDFSNPDLTFSCSQVEEAERDMHKTASCTAMCHFESNKNVIGAAENTVQRFMKCWVSTCICGFRHCPKLMTIGKGWSINWLINREPFLLAWLSLQNKTELQWLSIFWSMMLFFIQTMSRSAANGPNESWRSTIDEAKMTTLLTQSNGIILRPEFSISCP